jgi:hypothetical protein
MYSLRVFSFHFFFALFVLNHSKDAALTGEAEHMAHGISQRRHGAVRFAHHRPHQRRRRSSQIHVALEVGGHYVSVLWV